MSFLREATAEYDNPTVEIGLMTLDEFLDYRNPDQKRHTDDSYTATIDYMNKDYSRKTLFSHVPAGSDKKMTIIKTKDALGIYLSDKGYGNPLNLVGIVHNNTLYHSSELNKKEVPDIFQTVNNEEYHMNIKNKKKVKYITEYSKLLHDVAKYNLEEYNHLINRIRKNNETLEIRSEEKYHKENEGHRIVIINSEGLIVGAAQDEWRATLIIVADEYKGQGLGTLLGEIWYKHNPNYLSGGFTPQGERNAIKVWIKRIKTMLANGWYKHLIDEGKITIEKVRKIINSAKDMHVDVDTRKIDKSSEKIEKEEQDKPLVYIDEDDISFAIYDAKFFDDQDEDYIYANGFFRDSGDKTFLFSLDYERRYHRLASYIPLQIMKDKGELLYIGSEPSDVVEFDALPFVEIDGDYAMLTKDVVDIEKLKRVEKAYRKKHDQYDEIWNMMIELANSKWS